MSEFEIAPESTPEFSAETELRISSYLNDLQVRLTVPPSQMRRILEESDDHLREGIALAVAGGMSPQEAAASVIDRYGRPADVASSFAPGIWSSMAALLQPAVAATVLRAGVLLTGVGLLAIGVSGLLAQLFGTLWGESFVATQGPGVTYTAERCAQFEALVPDAGNCQQAATTHHFGEVVDGRVAAGVLGLVICLLYFVWARRSARPGPPSLLIGGIGVAAFGSAAVLLALVASSAMISGLGGGDELSAAIVGGLTVIAFLPSLGRGLRATRSSA